METPLPYREWLAEAKELQNYLLSPNEEELKRQYHYYLEDWYDSRYMRKERNV